jgi:ketosteroid isomerase-like protein
MQARIGSTLLALALLAGGARPAAAAPTAGEDALAAEIGRMDAAMFDAFNAHDLPALMALFSPDLEFFHDKGGLQRYAEVEAGFQRMFAQNNGIRRELLPETLEVYPIPSYGAVEIGTHRFCHVERRKTECGTFRFLQIWKLEGTSWKVTRVVSYGH